MSPDPPPLPLPPHRPPSCLNWSDDGGLGIQKVHQVVSIRSSGFRTIGGNGLNRLFSLFPLCPQEGHCRRGSRECLEACRTHSQEWHEESHAGVSASEMSGSGQENPSPISSLKLPAERRISLSLQLRMLGEPQAERKRFCSPMLPV